MSTSTRIVLTLYVAAWCVGLAWMGVRAVQVQRRRWRRRRGEARGFEVVVGKRDE